MIAHWGEYSPTLHVSLHTYLHNLSVYSSCNSVEEFFPTLPLPLSDSLHSLSMYIGYSSLGNCFPTTLLPLPDSPHTLSVHSGYSSLVDLFSTRLLPVDATPHSLSIQWIQFVEYSLDLRRRWYTPKACPDNLDLVQIKRVSTQLSLLEESFLSNICPFLTLHAVYQCTVAAVHGRNVSLSITIPSCNFTQSHSVQ